MNYDDTKILTFLHFLLKFPPSLLKEASLLTNFVLIALNVCGFISSRSLRCCWMCSRYFLQDFYFVVDCVTSSCSSRSVLCFHLVMTRYKTHSLFILKENFQCLRCKYSYNITNFLTLLMNCKKSYPNSCSSIFNEILHIYFRVCNKHVSSWKNSFFSVFLHHLIAFLKIFKNIFPYFYKRS